MQELASAGTPFAVATVVRTQGSTPQVVGAKLILTGDERERPSAPSAADASRPTRSTPPARSSPASRARCASTAHRGTGLEHRPRVRRHDVDSRRAGSGPAWPRRSTASTRRRGRRGRRGGPPVAFVRPSAAGDRCGSRRACSCWPEAACSARSARPSAKSAPASGHRPDAPRHRAARAARRHARGARRAGDQPAAARRRRRRPRLARDRPAGAAARLRRHRDRGPARVRRSRAFDGAAVLGGD